MKSNSKSMAQLLGYYAILGGVSILGANTHAYSNLNMGMSLNTGSALGAPMFGYGGAMGSMNALGGCFGQGGYLGGGGYMGGGMNLPPPPALIPPHLQGGGFMGAGMPGSPYLMNQGGCTTYCQPTMPYAMQNQGIMQNQGMMMNPGMMQNQGMMAQGSMNGSNMYSVAAGGTTVIDLRPRVEDNTGDVIWAAALGIGMQAPNVYPFVGDRSMPTNFGNFFYQEGNRLNSLQARPHASQ